MPGLKPVSGETVIKILSKQYGFAVSGQTGSHVRLSKATPGGRIGTVVPLHDEPKDRHAPRGSEAGEDRSRGFCPVSLKRMRHDPGAMHVL
ncbi:type II toxin-antitoxin system HicA family toxin [Methanoculleus sp.]|uniref:type II toxin-antitoxin system HicA family toxin n=1 Tax=Methanoculleus sp. TaxID=90427 RepID=UPI00344F066A